MRRFSLAAAALCALCAAPAAAQSESLDAQQSESVDAQPAVAWRFSFKSSGLFSQLPDDPILFPNPDTATGFWRFRVEPTIRLSDSASVDIAVEQRLRVYSSIVGAASILPPDVAAPYRIRPLDWELASGSNAEWRLEVDRAALSLHAGAAQLTIGRQAIGWGRGVLFSAVDMFSPFTPLEADREWRRGIDAVRADIRLGDRVSADGVAVFGTDFDHSIAAGRLRGYAGKADVELVGGWRARDLFGGVTTSAAVGEAEVHGELAVFRTPAEPGSLAFADSRSVIKAVAGGSYRLPIGEGVLVYAEYHYSGFGAATPEGILPLLADPAFQERYARGDTQILARHAIAVLSSYELSPEVSFAAQWLQSPTDGSGVLVPSTTLTFSDRTSLLLSGYVPYGPEPIGASFQSQFGASPLAFFVQLRLYR
jgi:hypothetical protein